MRAIQINYREGCTVTGCQVVGFPDHLSDDFIKGFETALRKVETVKSFERIDIDSTTYSLTSKTTAKWQIGQQQATASRAARVI